MQQLRLLLVALQFYSRIPVQGKLATWMGWDAQWLAPATRYLPAVGFLVALLQAGLWTCLLHFTNFPSTVSLILVMAFGVWLTGAFHEDGFADACDGFGGQHSAEKTLGIMRDSRLGTYGVMGLSLLMLGKFTVLQAGSQHLNMLAMLVCSATVSRAAVLLFIASLRYCPHEQGAKPLAKSLDRSSLLIGLALGLAPLVIWIHHDLPWQRALGCVALLFVVLWWWRTRVKARLGGYTGDTLGAAQQMAELAFLLALIA